MCWGKCGNASSTYLPDLEIWLVFLFAFQQEAGRYPAYKETVAEYGWLDKCMLATPKVYFLRLDIIISF